MPHHKTLAFSTPSPYSRILSSLISIVDVALVSATLRSGSWLACRAGCNQCCIGVFPISPLDADTLRDALSIAEPALAGRIRARATASRTRLIPAFPGDPHTGLLFTEDHHEDAFDDFANHEPCPVLDPVTGTCDLYAARPVQCRTFGPPMRDEDDSLTVCELCFVDAPPEEVARCEMDQSWRALEETQIVAAEERSTKSGNFPAGPTLVAFALSDRPPENGSFKDAPVSRP